jgi:hypothetical protein
MKTKSGPDGPVWAKSYAALTFFIFGNRPKNEANNPPEAE